MKCILFSLMIFCCTALFAQSKQTIKGVIVDTKQEPLIGATVMLKGSPTVGTVTDIDGAFTLSVPAKSILVVSYFGMITQEIDIMGQKNLTIVLEDDNKVLSEVIVVGYGQQKKESVVGAITQTTGKVLERAAGITNIGAALTGNLPGVITMASSGLPGEEEPQIQIRGASSWNGSEPLVLVDGVERPMASVDMASVQSLSVLKDASATAVYGVKGANGVILITTKRGQEGKAQINVSANAIVKMPSHLPDKLDSYDALMARNTAIENELNINPDSWSYIRSQDFIDNYRNQTSVEQRERYPNVNWQKELFRDYTMSYNANLNILGGTKFVKYFASVDYMNEGDLFQEFQGNRDYKGGYGYNRVNVRSNLDFQITKSTVLKVSLAGSNGRQKTPYSNSNYDSNNDWQVAQQWAGAYNISPDAFLPQYSDGSWGYLPGSTNVSNSAQNITIGGSSRKTTTRITTDFVLEQDLTFVTQGLNARGSVSWDNTFIETKRGINDMFNDPQNKWIDPDTGEVNNKKPYETGNQFDYIPGKMWNIDNGAVQDGSTFRNLYYQLQLNWVRKFDRHNVTAMGLFSRNENAIGSEIPHYREDWAFRVTYDFNNRYFFEYNGAYNGSEKFSSDNRFAFFHAGALGWMISEESFMKFLKDRKILDMLKIRASYGEIGDDNVNGRWLYLTTWSYGGKTKIDSKMNDSPYQWYRESAVGNEDVHWEKVKKLNYGIDYSFLNGMFAGNVEIFRDKRVDILVNADARKSIPSYYGQSASTVNMGVVKTKGYELELRFNKELRNDMRVWANLNMTHAENEIQEKDDPELYPAYRKDAGFAIGQVRSYLDKGFIKSYDEIYASPKHDNSDNQKLVGDYYIVDFNGDGVIDAANDNVPWGYPSIPQNTYNATIGYEWKGFSCFVQFYGVNNVTREVAFNSFGQSLNNVYDTGTWWSSDPANANEVTPRWSSKPSYHTGTQYLYDASYVRLKNAEIAYTFDNSYRFMKKIGFTNLKLFVSGNNLWVWSKLPDDRESNFAGASSQGAYPTVKRINFGIKFTL